MKLYQSEVWLKRKYLIEKKTAKEIAEMCQVTEMTIFRYLEKFGLIRNSRTWSKKR
jgi:DNA-directed RNA polymerase specialized sigma subunit